MSDQILVVDDEAHIRRFVEVNLRLEGWDVITAASGGEAIELALQARPRLILLDVMMPDMNGFEVCRRLRAYPRTAQVPVIFVTGRSMIADKITGLTAGADDYVLKPFDPIELIARVRTTLQRSEELRASSPLTGLPGNHRIQAHLMERFADDDPLAVVYADVNHFKAFNDRYGFIRGDEVILLTADILRRAAAAHAGAESFVGHVGGDDFMTICRPDVVQRLCETVIEEFDARIGELYDAADREAGVIEVRGRQGTERFPLMTIALGVASTERRRFDDVRELVETATEMKHYLKRNRGASAYAIDERVDTDLIGART